MIVWTPTVFECLICMRFVFYCICSCSAQLSMFHMEKRFRNTLIIIITVKYFVSARPPLSTNFLEK